MVKNMDLMTPDIWLSDPKNNLKMLENTWESLPELTMSSSLYMREGQMVRFRGMIQDMGDPVIYISKFIVRNERTGAIEKRYGKYRDVISMNDDEVILEDSNEHENGDRRSYYCISTPGLNKWAVKEHRIIDGSSASVSSADRKRSADESDDEMDVSSDISSNEPKRRETTQTRSTAQVSDVRNFPVVSASNYSCVVNIYDDISESVGGELRLNEEVEFAGFVNFSPDGVVDDRSSVLPSTLVPRLHAVSFRRGSSLGPLHSCLTNSVLDEVRSRADKVRSDLHMVLTILLLGDSLAADYLLCNLISKIYRRQDTLVLGKLSVNITNVPVEDDYPTLVYKFLTKLIPKSHYLPMDLSSLNNTSFLPWKDYENNCLITGALQLSDGTHLFLDETKLGEGKLIEKGLMNLKALENLILYQKLDCDFKYSRVEYPVDIPVIVMSEGKSLLMCDVNVRLCADDAAGRTLVERLPSEDGYPNGEALDDIRAYLAATSTPCEFSIPDEMMETIQEDYVKMRQEETKTSEFDLHNLLVLSRLISLSYGQDTLSRTSWDKAVAMERERKYRQSSAPAPPPTARVL